MLRLGVLLVFMLLLVTACAEDKIIRPDVDPPQTRDDVLNELQVAYNQRSLLEYQKLLDTDFLFFFADADVNDPVDPVPESWGWDDEMAATGHLFDPAYEGDEDPVTRISLTLQASPNWTPTEPEDPRFAGETWYVNVARYNLFVQTAGPTDFQAVDIQTEFTVRQSEVDGHMEWRIVRWRDDIDDIGGIMVGLKGLRSQKKGVSWGSVKWVYESSDDYRDLTEKQHVLENLETAYNKRNEREYRKLLDEAFAFHFSVSDVNNRSDPTPETWDRQAEEATAVNMFDPGYEGSADPITQLSVTLQPSETWIEWPPDPQHQGETWYAKLVHYNLFVQTAGPTDYQSVDIQAEIVIRFDGGTGRWQIVRWRDQIEARGKDDRFRVEQSAWGRIKWLYRQPSSP